MEIAIAIHVADKSQTSITKTLIRLKTIFLTIRGFWKFNYSELQILFLKSKTPMHQ